MSPLFEFRRYRAPRNIFAPPFPLGLGDILGRIGRWSNPDVLKLRLPTALLASSANPPQKDFARFCPSTLTNHTHFLLLPFADTRELQLLHFWLFLAIYLAALLGNGLIITAVACDHHLHTPMYFFLLNLSVLDLGSISTTVPKAMANSLWDTRDISYAGCAAQIFRAVLRIPSQQGRHKAFSTCLPHLAVVSLFVSTAIFAYLKSPSISSPSLDVVMAVLYSVVPPAVNPLIYSMRNQELKDSLWKLFEYDLLQIKKVPIIPLGLPQYLRKRQD
ncbi:olfactory receptor 14I1-like [Theristicus caerulescens]